MYFKINTPQKDKYTDMGMVNISASFYLEEGDEGWDKYQAEHHVTVPIIPEGGYKGKLGEDGRPDDQEDYDIWIKSLPTETRDNPFCNHAIQFEHDATEEEILWCFEWALAQTHLNYLYDDLHCEKGTPAKKVNQDIGYLSRKAFYEGVLQIPEKNRTDYMKQELAKIEKCNTRLTSIPVDFTTVKTIANYKVK